MLPGLAVLLIGALVFVVAVEWLFAPWIYLVGGRHRLLPIWQGVGEAQGPAGGYKLYLWFFPVPSRSRVLPSVTVNGWGRLCTARGEGYRVVVWGSAPGPIWRSMDGHAFRLAAYNRPPVWTTASHSQWRPSLTFAGRWVGPNLVMTDNGSLSRAFLPDGRLNRASTDSTPATATASVTFAETGLRPFLPACAGPRTPARP